MADDGSAQSANIWPLPKLHFEVKWDTQVMSFQEVSGLDVQHEEITYRRHDVQHLADLDMFIGPVRKQTTFAPFYANSEALILHCRTNGIGAPNFGSVDRRAEG